MASVVVLAGGSPHAHDYDDIGAAWQRLLRSAGHRVVAVDHPDMLVSQLDATVDVLVVSALFWQMKGAAYDRWRSDWGYTTPPATRTAISTFVAKGGGLVANHTAPICFDDWEEWGAIVGCRWQWGVSSHPPVGPCQARVVRDHAITRGAPSLVDIDDEVYGGLAVSAEVEVLGVAKRSPDDDDQPVLFTHRYHAGSVVFAGFGHHGASIEHPSHGPILLRSVEWAAPSAEASKPSTAASTAGRNERSTP